MDLGATTAMLRGQCEIGKGLRVVNASLGLAGALISKMMAEAGAEVIYVDPLEGNPFLELYPACVAWRAGAKTAGPSDLDELLASADSCLVGGEDYPGVGLRLDPDAMLSFNPRLVVLKLTGLVGGQVPAVDLLVQAATGLVHDHLSARPLVDGLRSPTYGAALLGLLGLWSALLQRVDSGRGQLVSTSLQQGAALFWGVIWSTVVDARSASFETVTPKDLQHLIFRCEDGLSVQIVLAVPGALATLYRILQIDRPTDPRDRGQPGSAADPRNYYCDFDLVASRVAKCRRDSLLTALWKGGLAAEPVLSPGDCWSDDQLALSGLIVTNTHGVAHVGMPIRLAESTGEYISRLAPAVDAKRSSRAPLAGIRVLDFGSFVAGPYASKLLCDLGAEVIKVEPLTAQRVPRVSRTTYLAERGKRCIAVDAKSPGGAALVKRLCATADLIHHNFRVGVAERLGIDSSSLRAIRSNVHCLHTSAYGPRGPKATRSGFDMTLAALCGHELWARKNRQSPRWYRSTLIDYAAGALGAIGSVMALYERRTRGGVVDVEVSLLSSALFLMSELVKQPDGQFVGEPTFDAAETGFHPSEALYQTEDGWVAVAARSSQMALRFANQLGLAESVGNPCSWGERERSAIAERVRVQRTDELLSSLRGADVWVERCVADAALALLGDSVARDAGLMTTLADRSYGTISGCFGPLVNFSNWNDECSSSRSVPKSGQHTRLILNELGLPDVEIDRLIDEGVVEQGDGNIDGRSK